MACKEQSLKTILLTRPEGDSKRIAPTFKEIHYDTIISPLIKITHLSISPLKIQNESVIITSPNGVFALKNSAKDVTIYCVGGYTFELLRKEGFKDIIVKPTAQELLHYLPLDESYIYLSGETITLDFSHELKNCQRIICYQTVPQRVSKEALMAFSKNEITHVSLYSRRTAEILSNFFMENEINLRDITLVVLSSAILTPLECFKFKEVLVADEPTHRSLLKVLG